MFNRQIAPRRRSSPHELAELLLAPDRVAPDFSIVLLERRDEEVRVEGGGGEGEEGVEESWAGSGPAES